MISFLRGKAAKFITYIFVVLLILGFIAWGIGDVLPTGGYQNHIAASIGKIQVITDDVNQRYRDQLNRLRQLGLPIDTKRAKSLGLADSIVNDIINESLYNLGANSLGLVMTDAQIRQEIQNDKTFKNQVGVFDRSQFNQILRNNGYTEASYIRELRQNIIRSQLLESLQKAVVVPKTLKEKIYNFRSEQRVATYFRIKDDSVKNVAEPSDSKLEKFYKQNASRFTAPEYRALTVAILHADDLAKEIAVSDEKIKEYYQSHIDNYAKPEKRTVKQMLFSDEKSAKDAFTMLQTGRKFSDVAKEKAKMDKQALELGTVTQKQLSRDLSTEAAAAVFKLKKGFFSQPVKSLLGWHVILVDSIEKGSKKQLSEVKAQIKHTIAKEKAIDNLFKLGTKIEDMMAGGATLEEAANQTNLKLRKITAIDRRGLNATGAPVTKLPAEGNFVGVAFDTPEGQDSPLTESGTDSYFIVRVDKITKPALRPLNTIRADAVSAWKAKQRRDNVKKQAQKFLDALKAGTPMGEIADKQKVALKTTEPFYRTGRDLKDRLPPSLIEQLFDALPGKTVMARDHEAYVLAQLKDIKPIDTLENKEEAVALTENLKQTLGNDILIQFANGLRKNHKVTINQSAIDQLYN